MRCEMVKLESLTNCGQNSNERKGKEGKRMMMASKKPEVVAGSDEERGRR